MSYDGNIISSPVNIDDVKQALGESSNDLATLCKSKNINILSKYKPTNYSIDFVQDNVNSDKKTWTAKDKNKAWWLGESRRYRTVYDFNIVNSIQQAKQLGAWKYNGPMGTSNSPYRLSDFIGYNSYDNEDYYFPINVMIRPDNLYTNTTINVHFIPSDEPEYINNVISLDDITNMLSLKFADKDHIYLGLFIANETTKHQGCVSCKKPISALDFNISGEGIAIEYNLAKGLIANNNDEDMYQYGALLCGKVSAGDIITVVPMMFNTKDIYESYNAVFSPGIVAPRLISSSNFANPIYTNKVYNTSEKPTEIITAKYKIDNIKFTKEYRTVYWGNDTNSYVVRSRQMLNVSFDLIGYNIGANNARIKIYAIGNDTDGTYIESDTISLPSTWHGETFSINKFISKGYTYYSQAAKQETVGDAFNGIPINIKLMQNENTVLDFVTKWDIYVNISADSFYDNDNNYIYNFTYEGDVLNENGLIYSEQY